MDEAESVGFNVVVPIEFRSGDAVSFLLYCGFAVCMHCSGFRARESMRGFACRIQVRRFCKLPAQSQRAVRWSAPIAYSRQSAGMTANKTIPPRWFRSNSGQKTLCVSCCFVLAACMQWSAWIALRRALNINIAASKRACRIACSPLLVPSKILLFSTTDPRMRMQHAVQGCLHHVALASGMRINTLETVECL